MKKSNSYKREWERRNPDKHHASQKRWKNEAKQIGFDDLLWKVEGKEDEKKERD